MWFEISGCRRSSVRDILFGLSFLFTIGLVLKQNSAPNTGKRPSNV